MRTKSSQFCIMIGFLMFSCFLGIGAESCLAIGGINFWMIPPIATILGLPIILMYIYIFNNSNQKNINELNEELFGKTLGKIISIFLLLFVISFNLITFWNLTSFVSSQYLYNTPSWFITVIFIIPSIYLIIKGPRILFRTTFILFYFAIILYIISALGLASQIKLTNIQPILENGITPVLKGIYNYVSYMILPIFLILIVPRNQIEGKNLNRYLIITYLVTNTLIFIIMFFTLAVFGIELTSLYQYSSYHILKRVFIGGFIERMENTLSIQWIIGLFVPTLFGFYYTSKSIEDIFKIKNKLNFIIIIIIMYFSQYIFKNNTFSEFFTTKYYPLIMGIFFIIIPFIITITIFYKKKIQKVSLKKIEN